ncbi:MAG TPA: hypothetical protein VMS18_27345 [Candidatus Binatia bacterium]|nr:hypothetical protein [Candidatus Binatia bacterium]
MITIRKFAYAAVLAVSALTLASNAAVAEAPAHGKFTLAHDVRWGNALVPAGDYEFSYDPYVKSPILTLTKVSGTRASYMLLVLSAEDSKATNSNRLVLETVADGNYVSTMELAECGMTLYFTVPSHPAKQMAKTATTVASSGQ